MRMNFKKTSSLALALLVAPAVFMLAPVAQAADHADGPAASLDPTADIADVYSWTSASGATSYFIMDIGKDMQAGSTFSDAVKYVFHTASMPAYGAAAAAIVNLDIVCTFDSATVQNASCWLGTDPVLDMVTGDADATGANVLTSSSGHMSVFAGLRDDPFFFNLAGFVAVTDQVHAAAGSLTFDPDGCPNLGGTTGPALVAQLSHAPGGGAPVDAFAAFNTLSIAIAVDTALVTAGGPVMSVWASTNH